MYFVQQWQLLVASLSEVLCRVVTERLLPGRSHTSSKLKRRVWGHVTIEPGRCTLKQAGYVIEIINSLPVGLGVVAETEFGSDPVRYAFRQTLTLKATRPEHGQQQHGS